MVNNNSASEYLSPRETGNTRQELDRLKKIIGDKDKRIKIDNINFAEKDKNKDDKAEALDASADTLFDEYMLSNEKIIKGILNSGADIEEKRKSIKELFHGFLTNIDNYQTSDEGLKDAINIFKTLKETKEAQIQTQIEITQFELQNLEDDVLGFVYTEANTNITGGSYAGFNSTHGYGFRRENIENTTGSDVEIINKKNNKGKFNKNTDKDNFNQNTDKDNFNQNTNPREEMNFKRNENYHDAYEQVVTDYHNTDNSKYLGTSEEKIEDIYSDKRVAKVLEKIFDKDDLLDIKRNDFEINLNTENGLARIVLDIAKKTKENNITISGDDTIFSILKDTLEKEKQKEDPNYEIGTMEKFKIKDTKKILELLNIPYTKDGIFGDFKKLTNLFNNAQREDLITFANLIESRANIARASKELYNNKILVNDIDKGNVFQFLSDINGDGILSADSNRKNKEQFKYGDLGNLSGQQLLFTINQAIKTQDVVLGIGKGENLVVKNIARMVDIMAREEKGNPAFMTNLGFSLGTDIYSVTYKQDLSNLFDNPSADELVKIIKKYPQTKGLFFSAIEKVAGGSSINQSDLYDVLVGQEGKKLQEIDTTSETENIRRSLDLYLRNNKDLQKYIQENGAIEVRESLLQQIMEKVDNISLQISFDPATNQDMIMSEVSKTYYREQAKKTILGEINIKEISLGASLQEIKVTYQIGKSHISNDGRSKYQISGGPSFYLGENGFAAGLEASFSRAEQINFDKVTSASLSDVQDAKYLGVEGGAGAKIQKDGLGIYALLGVSTEKDALMGISQLEKVYQSVSNRIFSLDGLTTFNSESIRNYLKLNIASLNKGVYRNFVNNNINKLNKDIDNTVNYLKTLGIIEEINASKKTEQEKKDAISSILRIIQQGSIDQRKGDIIMNLHNQLKFTKFSAGLSAGTRFFGTKSDNYKGTGTAGTGTETPNVDDPQITGEEGGVTSGGSNGGESRLSFLGVYVGARLSTWKNTYLPNSKQLLFTQQEMNKGVIDQIEAGKDLNKYAKYLEALFNKPDLHISVYNGNLLQINYTPETLSAPSLTELLNIHYLPEKQNEFALQGNRLIIGNIGPIAAYTTTLPGKVDRVLCLGTKNLNEAIRVKSDNIPNKELSGIEFKENGFENFTKENLYTTIDGIQKGSQQLDIIEKDFYKTLFDVNGKLIDAPANCTYNSTVRKGMQFSTGTLTLYKKSDGKYILDYQANTDNKLHIDYKTIGTVNSRTDVPGTLKTNPSISQNLSNLGLPLATDIPNIEHPDGTLKKEFISFTKAIINADFDTAVKELIAILPTNTNKTEILQNIKTLQNGSEEEKLYIIDSYTSLFAYETVYNKQNLSQIFAGRGKTFLNYKGLKQTFKELGNELLIIRDTFIKNNKNEQYSNLSKKIPDNVFGYSAFYRKGTIDGERGYGITTLGETNIIIDSITELGNGKSKIEKEKNQMDGKKRIVENLSKDEKHTELLIKQIKKAINNPDISKYITKDNVGEFITKGELVITDTNSQNTIDISSKKLILNSTAIFYLLGECINESIGLRINEIKLVTDTYTAEGTPDTKYISNIFGRSDSIVGDVNSERYDLSLRGHKKLGEKTKSNNKPYNGEGKPGEGDDLPGGDDDGIDGE